MLKGLWFVMGKVGGWVGMMGGMGGEVERPGFGGAGDEGRGLCEGLID